MENSGVKKDRIKAIIYTLLAAILLSTGGILLKYIDMHPMAIASMRGAIASVVVLIYLRKPQFTFSKPQVFGAICYACMVTFFIISNKLTTAANAIVLQFTAPIWVALLSSWLLKEKIKWYDWASIAIVSGGMILFFLDSVGGGSTAGNIIAILSGVALAGSTIGLRLLKDSSPVENTLLGHIITILVGLPFIFGATFTFQNIVILLLLGIFQLGISYILFALAMKHLTALESILIMFLEPILNPIWVIIFYGERPSIYSLIGGLIVILTLATRSIIVNRELEKH